MAHVQRQPVADGAERAEHPADLVVADTERCLLSQPPSPSSGAAESQRHPGVRGELRSDAIEADLAAWYRAPPFADAMHRLSACTASPALGAHAGQRDL
jgi:hypothetical protein